MTPLPDPTAENVAPDPRKTDTPGEPPNVQVTERPNGKKGCYRVVALNDIEATFRHHGADKGEAAKIAYNNSLLTGTRYIHFTQADTGARPDPEALPEMLRAQFT